MNRGNKKFKGKEKDLNEKRIKEQKLNHVRLEKIRIYLVTKICSVRMITSTF